jgi:hypothetical protein
MAAILVCLLLGGCGKGNLPETIASATHTSLPPADCSIPLLSVVDVSTDASDLGGDPKYLVPGNSPSGPVIGATAYDGLFVARLSTRGPIRFSKLAAWGVDPGMLSRVSGIWRGSDSSWTFVDPTLVRRTTLSARGKYEEHLPLRLPQGTDFIGVGPKGVFAFATSTEEHGYARARATLFRLEDDRRFVPESTLIISPSRHSTAGGVDLSLAQRPLEQDPIIAENDSGEFAIQTSDSIEITLIGSRGGPVRFHGSGARVTFRKAEIDSAAAAYGKKLLPSDPERPAADARRMLFRDRHEHQLADHVQWLSTSRIAIRRNRACADRQLWYVVDRSGRVVSYFALALQLDPVGGHSDTLFFRRTTGPLRFAWTAVDGKQQ